jgi:hypothetical protein
LRIIELKRPSINITPAERLARLLIGAALVIGAIFLVQPAGTMIVVLQVLLVLAGLDLIVTGGLGHCPLYRKLGHLPPSLRGSA